MTLEEAARLTVGDEVEAYIGRRQGWRRCRVHRVHEHHGWVDVVLHREAALKSGLPRTYSYTRRPDRVRPRSDPAVANVYADFLEQNGFAEASAALRKEFPLGPPVQPPAG